MSESLEPAQAGQFNFLLRCSPAAFGCFLHRACRSPVSIPIPVTGCLADWGLALLLCSLLCHPRSHAQFGPCIALTDVQDTPCSHPHLLCPRKELQTRASDLHGAPLLAPNRCPRSFSLECELQRSGNKSPWHQLPARGYRCAGVGSSTGCL